MKRIGVLAEPSHLTVDFSASLLSRLKALKNKDTTTIRHDGASPFDIEWL